MAQLTPPTIDDDSRALWRVVAELVKRMNALENCSINLSGTRNKLTVTESNATLELDGRGLHLVQVDWCEGGVQGKRLALLGDFTPNS